MASSDPSRRVQLLLFKTAVRNGCGPPDMAVLPERSGHMQWLQWLIASLSQRTCRSCAHHLPQHDQDARHTWGCGRSLPRAEPVYPFHMQRLDDLGPRLHSRVLLGRCVCVHAMHAVDDPGERGLWVRRADHLHIDVGPVKAGSELITKTRASGLRVLHMYWSNYDQLWQFGVSTKDIRPQAWQAHDGGGKGELEGNASRSLPRYGFLS